MMDKHFPVGNPLRKIFNRNNVKVSYSCMPNMETIIKSHNKQLLKKHQETSETTNPRTCNCRTKTSCPLGGKCLTEALVYKATIVTENEEYSYVGMTGRTFKERWYKHGTSFRLAQYRTETKLSEKVWSLKERGCDYMIRWSVVKRGRPYVNGQRTCDLCTTEKLEILLQSSTDPHLLNSRSEIMNKCRHKNKFSL